jgi:putative transposase
LAPLVRRSLAPRGRPLVIKHRAKHRDKVSLIGALTISPVQQRLGLYFQNYPLDYVTNDKAAAFVEGLLVRLRGRLIVVWDRGNMHKGPPIRSLLERYRDRLTIVYLPPYAPDLNPVEALWSYLKYAELVNFAPRDVPELDAVAREQLERVQQQRPLLQSFWDHAKLPFPERSLVS